jgi:peptidoglycan/xylan/chitin deacetylase (PgdA/CDA1 family)
MPIPDPKVVMWDVLSGDFDINISPERCVSNILKRTGPGSIIVFHDSEKAFPRLKVALPKMLNHYSELGYRFKAL